MIPNRDDFFSGLPMSRKKDKTLRLPLPKNQMLKQEMERLRFKQKEMAIKLHHLQEQLAEEELEETKENPVTMLKINSTARAAKERANKNKEMSGLRDVTITERQF